MSPLVSILIPNYNKDKYLKKSLESVIAQTYTNWECIVVDDHSTDSSWEILKEYAIKDIRFKIHRRPVDRKKGGNAARNYAIELAKGEFIAFLDSDDYWNPRRLELAIDFILSNNYLAIFSGANVIRSDEKIKIPSREIRAKESIFDFILSDDVFCPTPSLIMRKDIGQKVKFDENLKRHQDYDFFIRVYSVYPWKYFENFDVQVNWSRPNINKINYFYCIPFYEKHWEKSLNKKIRYKYIIRITSSSVRKNFKYNLANYFKNILIDEGYKFSFIEYLLFYTPMIFILLSKIKWIIYINFTK